VPETMVAPYVKSLKNFNFG